MTHRATEERHLGHEATIGIFHHLRVPEGEISLGADGLVRKFELGLLSLVVSSSPPCLAAAMVRGNSR